MRHTLIPTVLLVVFSVLQPLPSVIAQTPSDQSEAQLSGSEVLLDLVVTDKKGKAVTDLKPGDVQVSENGVPQSLTSFDLVRSGVNASGDATGAPAGAASSTSSPTVRHANLITIVVDRTSVTEDGLTQVYKGVERFVNERLASNDLVAVFASTNRPILLQNFTNDKVKLLDATRMACAGTSVLLRESLDPVARADIVGAQGSLTAGNDMSTQIYLASRNIDVEFANLRDQIQSLEVIESLLAITKAYAKLPIHKSILFYSAGFVINDGSDGAYKSLVNAANRSNCTIHTVSTLGLVQNRRIEDRPRTLEYDESDNRMSVVGGESGIDRAVRPILTNNDNALSRLATDTGGVLIRNTNDFGKGFQAIENGLHSYYALAYAPSNADFDGSYRAIDVKVARKDVEVFTRKGYYAIPGGNDALLLPFEPAVLSMIADASKTGDRPSNIRVMMRTERFRSGSGWRIPIVLGVEAGDLGSAPVPAPKEKNEPPPPTLDFRVDAVVLVRDATRKVLTRQSQSMTLRTTPASLADFKSQVLPFAQFADPLVLPPGSYTLQIGVYDPFAKRGTVVERKISVPAVPAPEEPALSSLVLGQGAVDAGSTSGEDPFVVGDKRVMPNASGRFVKAHGDKMIAMFDAYGTPGAQYQMRINFMSGDKVVSSTPLTTLPAIGSTGHVAASFVYPIDAFPEGDYRAMLYLVAQGSSTAAAMTSAPFSIAP